MSESAEAPQADLPPPRWRGLAGRLPFGLAFAGLLALAALGLGIFEIPQTCVLPPGQVQPDQGFLYKYHDSLPAGDNTTSGICALPLVLYENGQPLGPAHADHEAIRTQGGGRFSHWGHSVYFSSSDNTDPRANGRTYTVRFSWQVPRWLWALATVLTLASFWPARPWRLLAGLLACALLALIVHTTGLLPARLERHVYSPASVHVEGKLFRYGESLPHPDGGQRGTSDLRLFEDGRPLGPPHARHKEIALEGAGRFSHFGGNVFFSTSDGSDPRTNGRTYTVTYPWDPPPWAGLALLAALCAALYLAGFFRRTEEAPSGTDSRPTQTTGSGANPWHQVVGRLDSLSPVQLGGLVLACAAGYRVVVVALCWHGDVGGFVVRGMPFSDANGWFTMSQELALGERWDGAWVIWGGLRPFYYVFMGSILALTGPTVTAVRCVQIPLSLAGTGLVFDLLRRLVRAPLAFVLTLSVCFSYSDALFALSPSTETVGNFLNTFALWLLVWGLERRLARRTSEPARWRPWQEWPFVASGAVLGLSNLARPLTLPALVPLALALGLLLWRRRGVARRWRTGGAVFAALVLGVALALTPWLVRQKAVYGVAAVSTNSAAALFAATSPEFGSWCAEVDQLANRLPTVAERVAFYEEHTRQNLREHFAWYAGNVARYLGFLTEDLRAPAWFLALCALFSAAYGLRLAERRRLRARWALLVPVLALAFLGAVPEKEHYFWVLGLALALVTAEPLLLVGAVLTGGLLTLALTALVQERLYLPLHWMTCALSGWAIWRLTLLVCARQAGVTDGLPTGAEACAVAGVPLASASGSGCATAGDDAAPHPAGMAPTEQHKPAHESADDAGISSPLTELRPTWGAWGRGVRWFGVVALAAFLAGAGRMVYRNVFESHPRPEFHVTGEERERWVSALLADPAYQPYAFLRDALIVGRVRHRDGVVARFGAGEGVEDLGGLFCPRPFAFCTFATRYEGYGAFAGEMRHPRGDLVVVGLRLDPRVSGVAHWIEVLGYAPDGGAPEPAQLVRVDPQVIAAHAEYIREFRERHSPGR